MTMMEECVQFLEGRRERGGYTKRWINGENMKMEKCKTSDQSWWGFTTRGSRRPPRATLLHSKVRPPRIQSPKNWNFVSGKKVQSHLQDQSIKLKVTLEIYNYKITCKGMSPITWKDTTPKSFGKVWEIHLQELGDQHTSWKFPFSQLWANKCPRWYALSSPVPCNHQEYSWQHQVHTSDRFPKMDDVRFWPKTFVSIVLSSQIPLRSPSILSTSVKTGG